MLKIQCAPVTWPIGMGRDLLGVYHLLEDRIYVYVPEEKGRVGSHETIEGIASAEARDFLGDRYRHFVEEVELVRGASPRFDLERYRAASQTPVFFGSAVNNFGVRELLRAFVQHSPGPAAAPDAASAWSMPRRRSSRASYSKFRPTWIPATATASLSCACARAAMRAACGCIMCASARTCALPMR